MNMRRSKGLRALKPYIPWDPAVNTGAGAVWDRTLPKDAAEAHKIDHIGTWLWVCKGKCWWHTGPCSLPSHTLAHMFQRADGCSLARDPSQQAAGSAAPYQQEYQLPRALQATVPVFSTHANTFKPWAHPLDRMQECLGALDKLLELEQPCQHGTAPRLRNMGA